MGYQLWMSPETGYRRQGTRFESLHRIFLENAKLLSLLEPILSCKESSSATDVKSALEMRDFDVTCVVDNEGVVIGQIKREELKEGRIAEYRKDIEKHEKVDENDSLVHLLKILHASEFKYVTRDNKIVGIVTRSDLNKPIPRTYLFGVVSSVELHINFWISYYFPGGSWLQKLNEKRQGKVLETIQSLKEGSSDYLSGVGCAQLCDKRDILRNSPKFLEVFGFSKTGFTTFLKRLEKVRNGIAHSQSSIIEQLSWEDMAQTISKAENFVCASDKLIEVDGKEKSKGFEQTALIQIPVV